ncbi:MAG TPA: ribosome biogenesis GTP-binding protein YihA/YsxC [Candidatus Polarisedimenticolia bacterium]|nr:ribosome biogenesis GTP-binding protein YihA/YsxC [Candidatus Polarisedimenticolia bacterium]
MSGATQCSDFPAHDLPEVAFLGRSNVGKSSLLNALIGRKLARVSRTPGRTQQAHFYCLDEALLFVDLPGYGFARAPAEVRAELARIIESYLTAQRPLAVAVLLIDSRHEPSALDQGMNAWLGAHGLPVQVVGTKVDKLSRRECHRSLERAGKILGRENIIPFSSQTGEGKRELWQAIDSRIESLGSRKPASRPGAAPVLPT